TGMPLEGRGLVTMGPLKVIVAGALGSHSAYTRERYTDGHGYAGRGVLSVGPEALHDALARARAQGLTAAVHAIGDAAAQVALAAIERVGIPARIEHAQMLTDDDITAMAALGVTASVQPAHLLDDRDATETVWPGHGEQAFRLRDLREAGVPLALGSDADERPSGHPAQQPQPREALAASTDGITSLRPGGVGDVVLLEGDPFADVPLGADGLMVESAARDAADRLRETQVHETLVAGVP